MRNKFWYLTKESFKKKVNSKWFIIANIILFLAFIAVVNIDRIITYFGGDFDSKKEIVVIDETNYAYDILISNFESVNSVLNMDYEQDVNKSSKLVEDAKEDIKDTDKILIVLSPSQTDYLDVTIISDSYIDTTYYQYLYQAVSNTKMQIALSLSNVNIEEFQKITSAVEIERIILNEEETSKEESMNMIMGTVFPTLILPFFILVVFLVQMIGMEINEEKSSRSMEIIISNVPAKVHFYSKIFASNAFIFLQSFLLILYGIIAIIIRNLTGGAGIGGEIGIYLSQIIETLSSAGILGQLAYIIPLTLILMLLSFVTYSLVAGILASMTVNMEDFQQIQTPIMFLCLIGYYLSIMSSMFQGSVFIKVLSYVPFFSSLLSPALLITNQIHVLDLLISVVILILFNYLLAKYGLKIYKVGILNYSTDKMWSKIFKAAKEKKS